jgi:transcriptional antiterminator NusG
MLGLHRMSHPLSDPEDLREPDRPPPDEAEASTGLGPSNLYEVEESSPDGGQDADVRERESLTPAPSRLEPTATSSRDAAAEGDEEPAPELVWYVLKVQSGREDTIRDALERRVKIQGLSPYFGRIVVPTEKITEIRNNRKRVVERKSYPGYIMVEMELNEKTWFLVRETPGVGDFVGAHGTPTKMTADEVNKMLGQETAKDEKPAPIKFDFERGDRVKIKDGPFENFEGTVEDVIEQRGLVKVMLIIFNRPTPVDLEYWQVERI